MLPFPDEFYGSVTTNEKGQVVIPAEARKELKINPGDKLLVLKGPGGKGLMMIKPEILIEFANKFEVNKNKLKNIIKKESK